MRALHAVPLLLLVGCAGRSAILLPADSTPEGAMPGNKTPHVDVPFVDGPAIADPGLLAWLEANRAHLLQLPVVVDFDNDLRGGGTRAWLGTEAPAAAANATTDATTAAPGGPIEVRLDDSALGVALIDHLRRVCPVGPRVCAVWLEGRWEAGLQIGGADDDTAPFRVLHFVGPADATATHARIEAAP
ncbi:MAG: hypothetical protein V4850_05655 [Myxococcota bacterium]